MEYPQDAAFLFSPDVQVLTGNIFSESLFGLNMWERNLIVIGNGKILGGLALCLPFNCDPEGLNDLNNENLVIFATNLNNNKEFYEFIKPIKDKIASLKVAEAKV